MKQQAAAVCARQYCKFQKEQYNSLLSELPSFTQQMLFQINRLLAKRIINILKGYEQEKQNRSIHFKMLPYLFSTISDKFQQFKFAEVKFPYLHEALKQFRRMNIDKKYNFQKQKVLEEEASIEYKEFIQRKNLQSQQSNKTISKIKQTNQKVREITFSETKQDCVGCIKFFYKNYTFQRDLPRILCLEKEQYLEQQIVGSICALLNEKGGYIFLGINDLSKRVKGFICSEEQKQYYQSQKYIWQDMINPFDFRLKIDFVPVYQKLKGQLVEKQEGLYIVRIQVIKEKNGGFYHIKFSRKGFHVQYSTRVIKNNKVYEPQGEQLYQEMYKIERKKYTIKNRQLFTHQKHLQPQKGIPVQKGRLNIEKFIQKENQIIEFDSSFLNQSLLVISSAIKLDVLKQLKIKLEQKKISYRVNQTFRAYQPKNGRQMFLFEYNEKFKNMSKIASFLKNIKLFKIGNEIKITYIEKNDFQSLQELFEQRFEGSKFDFKYQKEKKNQLRQVTFITNNLVQAIFLFVWLQYSNIRPSF